MPAITQSATSSYVESKFKCSTNFIKNSANINALDAFGRTAKEWCYSHQVAVIFDLLLDHGAELPINKDSFLQNLASEKFGYVIIKSFFSRLMKGFVNNKNVFGQTPLYAAVIQDLYKNVHAFMSYPMINTEIKDYDNNTALNYAKKYKSKKAGRVLGYYNHTKQLFRKPNWGHTTEHLTIPMQLPSEIAAIIAYHAASQIVSDIEIEENKKLVNQNK